MSSSDDLLKLLNSWKNSEGVTVTVWWSSGIERTTFSFRGQVFDADSSEIHFFSSDKGANVSMTISLEDASEIKIDRQVNILFRSKARLVMAAVPQ